MATEAATSITAAFNAQPGDGIEPCGVVVEGFVARPSESSQIDDGQTGHRQGRDPLLRQGQHPHVPQMHLVKIFQSAWPPTAPAWELQSNPVQRAEGRHSIHPNCHRDSVGAHLDGCDSIQQSDIPASTQSTRSASPSQRGITPLVLAEHAPGASQRGPPAGKRMGWWRPWPPKQKPDPPHRNTDGRTTLLQPPWPATAHP